MSGNSVDKWNRCFYILGLIVFCVGLINLFLLKEYPAQLGLEIKERGNFLDPSRVKTRLEDLTREDDLDQTIQEEQPEDGEDIPSMPFCDAIKISGVLQFAMSFFFIKFAFYGVYYWVPTYL